MEEGVGKETTLKRKRSIIMNSISDSDFLLKPSPSTFESNNLPTDFFLMEMEME